MARRSGFMVTVKFFVPISKTNFLAQANASKAVHEIATGKKLTEDFLALAEVNDVTAKQTSVEGEAPAAD